MALVLLIVIYVVFIGLGLPDGVLGSAWPAIRQDLKLHVELGGLIAVVVTCMTILSSLATATLVKKLGVGLLLAVSTGLTAVALIGFSQVDSLVWLILFAVPLGLGAGAIDSALNNYVANHYDAHHMNWLHAFWGVGAAIGPIIFSAALVTSGGWHNGYSTLGWIQAGIVALLVLSLSLWSKVHQRKQTHDDERVDPAEIKFGKLLKERAVFYTFIAFLFYVGIEVAVGLWVASYLTNVQSVAIEAAALWTGLYYAAITVGRALTGFISFKVPSKQMIRYGLIVALVGILLLVMNIAPAISVIGISLVGLGFAPIYPGLIHAAPERFGARKSAKIMSLQMVGGYLGASLIPPAIGLISGMTSLLAFAFIAPLMIACLILSTERVNSLVTKQS